jgi:hypothetical protein
MQFVGWFAVGIGVIAAMIGAGERDASPVLVGLLYGIIGFWTARAGGFFRKAAEHRGHDVEHLMHALVEMKKLFTLQYWVCLVALVGALLLLSTTALRGG